MHAPVVAIHVTTARAVRLWLPISWMDNHIKHGFVCYALLDLVLVQIKILPLAVHNGLDVKIIRVGACAGGPIFDRASATYETKDESVCHYG